MHTIRRTTKIIASGLLLASFIATVHAAEPSLLWTEYTDSNNKIIKVRIKLAIGAQLSPTHDKPLGRLTLRSGDKLIGNDRPQDLTIELRRGPQHGNMLVCALNTRYFREADGRWAPYFKIVQESFVTKGPDGRDIPVTAPRGNARIKQFDTTPANTEGYSSLLQLGFIGEPLQVDVFVVR